MRPLFGPTMVVVALLAASACSTEELGVTKYKIIGTDAVIVLPDIGPDVGLADTGTVTKLSLVGVSPSHGPFVGGATVLIQGTGFTKTCKVQIGGKNIQVGKTKFSSSLSLTVVTPAGKPGAVDVEITCGSNKAKLASGYTYDPVYMDPNSGPTAGGTLVNMGASDGFVGAFNL